LRALISGSLPAGTPAQPTAVSFSDASAAGARGGTQSGSTAGGIAGGALAGAGFIRPVPGSIGDGFGVPRPGGRTHKGVDIIAPAGTPIAAAAAGYVSGRGYDLGAGNYINLTHPGGIVTKYFHQSRFAVSAGERVTQGQIIGYVGATGDASGPHLHFEIWINGQAVDPAGYIGG